MNLQNAKEIGKKARAYEHCAKLLKEIEKNGSAVMKINCTGMEFKIEKGDGIKSTSRICSACWSSA